MVNHIINSAIARDQAHRHLELFKGIETDVTMKASEWFIFKNNLAKLIDDAIHEHKKQSKKGQCTQMWQQ